jgi:hypothetical protein
VWVRYQIDKLDVNSKGNKDDLNSHSGSSRWQFNVRPREHVGRGVNERGILGQPPQQKLEPRAVTPREPFFDGLVGLAEALEEFVVLLCSEHRPNDKGTESTNSTVIFERTQDVLHEMANGRREVTREIKITFREGLQQAELHRRQIRDEKELASTIFVRQENVDDDGLHVRGQIELNNYVHANQTTKLNAVVDIELAIADAKQGVDPLPT